MNPESKPITVKDPLEIGIALLNAGDFTGSLSVFERLLAQNPEDILSAFNAGVASHRLGQYTQAIGYYLRSIQGAPDFIEAYFNIGNAYIRANNPLQAVASFKKAVEINPSYTEAHYNLGLAYEKIGDFEKALTAYGHTIRINPNHDRALNNIGVIHRDRENTNQALQYFKKAMAVNPNLAEAHYNMGVTLQKNGHYEKGITCYLNALRINPEYAPATWFSLLSLPMLYSSSDDIRKHRTRFKRNLKELIATTSLDTHAQRQRALQGLGVFTCFLLQYQGLNDIEIQKIYGGFVHRLMAACYPKWSEPMTMPSSPISKIRIGYVSAFMYGHTVGDYLLGWIQNHDRRDFEIFCYHLGSKDDAITQRLRSTAIAFYHANGDVESVATKISEDQLHVLVYADIGMCPLSTQLAALRLAPVQCVHFGHPVTTGLPTMDYFLTSELMEPEDADAHYTERLMRLPNLSVCFTSPKLPSNPRSRTAFGIAPDRFVFLSTQSLYKYLPQHDDIYPEISAMVPQALFVFISSAGAGAYFKERLYAAFARYGLRGENFCLFLPKLDHADFLSLNLCADVLLDSLEWSGCHTTLEALACGLPVVTLPGELMRGRHSYAILMMMGLRDTIAADKQAYIRIASRLAKDRTFYNKARNDIAANRHRVFNDRTVIHQLEDFYRSVVRAPSDLPKHRTEIRKISPAESAQRTAADEETCYLRTLELEPDNLKAAFGLGSLYLVRNDGDQALEWLLKVREKMPESAAVHNNVGKAYLLTNNPDMARDSFQRACCLDPDLAQVWFNLAELDQRAGSLEQAVTHYEEAVRIDPLMSAAYNNMGNALRDLKRYPEAIAVFQKVIALEPNLAQGHYNLGSTLRLSGQNQQAMVHLSKTIQLQPDYIDAWNNLALTCKNVGDLDRALNYLNKALQIQPDFSLAHWNRSFVHFLQGNWAQGWQDYEWRFQVPQWRTIYPHRISGKPWNGDPMPGQTLLVHDEQGLGDTFQFVRFLPLARQRCGRLILETRSELSPLLENTLGIDELIIRSNTGPPAVSFDQYIPLMSLGRIFKADPGRMPVIGAYIQAPQEKITQWGQRVPTKGLNIGLVWAGRPEHANDDNRSCRLELFTPLFDLPGINFIGLQKGPAAAQAGQIADCETFKNWGDDLKSFSDTAGLIQHLDIVLTVDTSVAHLAGAMGKPVWVLIPFLPDWRWSMNATQTGWYPTMRLFRQPKPKDWESVLVKINQQLEIKAPHMNRNSQRYGV